MASNDAPAAKARPLSPHLGIYRWQWTMALSILHRITGVALVIGTAAFAWWIIAAAAGGEHYAASQWFWGSWLGRIMLLGWSFCLFYHLLNGIRHLVWDAGGALALGPAKATGVLAFLGAVALTVVAWVVAYANL